MAADNAQALVVPDGCVVLTAALDFEPKVEQTIAPADTLRAIGAHDYVWIDIDLGDMQSAPQLLKALGLLSPEVIEDILEREPGTQHSRYDDYIHLVVTGAELPADDFELARVDAVISGEYLLTIHTGKVTFLQQMRREYRADFMRFARSPSFLIYELWDHLCDNYVQVQKFLENQVESLQSELMKNVDDRVFARVSDLGTDLLHFRKVLLPARTVLTDLSTRKSLFISEATQPFLANMVGTIERVLQDLLVDRGILAESLNLYMSMVGHKTNEVMKKLTVVSFIFLPLTFLCGVYGMNFELMPELRWGYGYAFFWGLATGVSGVLLWIMRKHQLL